MNFTYYYTPEQQRFRQVLIAWLDNELSTLPMVASKTEESAPDLWGKRSGLRRRLGQKGWLAPGEPKECGGLGATQELEVVLWEELEQRGFGRVLDEAAGPLRRALRGWGTEDQKQRLLMPIATGEVAVWHSVTDPEEDSKHLGIEAVEDGDEYILNGEGVFKGSASPPDYLWTLALIDPVTQASACFLVPMGLEGVFVATPRQLAPGAARLVNFNDVRVPRYCLFGQEGNGWDIMNLAFADEPQAKVPRASDPKVDDLLKYAHETTLEGVLLSDQPVMQQLQMEAYIDSRIGRLFEMRDRWMRESGRPLTYHSAQTRLWKSRAAFRLSEIVLQVVGIYSLLDDQDPRSPAGGGFEHQQRRTLVEESSNNALGAHRRSIAKALGLD